MMVAILISFVHVVQPSIKRHLGNPNRIADSYCAKYRFTTQLISLVDADLQNISNFCHGIGSLLATEMICVNFPGHRYTSFHRQPKRLRIALYKYIILEIFWFAKKLCGTSLPDSVPAPILAAYTGRAVRYFTGRRAPFRRSWRTCSRTCIHSGRCCFIFKEPEGGEMARRHLNRVEYPGKGYRRAWKFIII